VEELIYTLGSLAALTLLVIHITRGLLTKQGTKSSEERERMERLEAELESIRRELKAYRDDQLLAVDDLAERLEFTERLLAQGRGSEAERLPEPTPV